MDYEEVIENIIEQGKHDLDTRAKQALQVLVRYGQIDGSHHKAWVIDSAVHYLAGVYYSQLIAAYKDGEDGLETYGWDEGIPP